MKLKRAQTHTHTHTQRKTHWIEVICLTPAGESNKVVYEQMLNKDTQYKHPPPQGDLFTSPLQEEKEVLPYRINHVSRIIDFLCLINESRQRNWFSDPPTVSYRSLWHERTAVNFRLSLCSILIRMFGSWGESSASQKSGVIQKTHH